MRAPSHHTEPPTHHIHLVRRRGGETVPRAHAILELELVFGKALVVTDDAHGQRPFVCAHFTIDDREIASRAHRLGYTRAIVRRRVLTDDGARATPVQSLMRDGVPYGAWRDAGAHVYFEPVVVVDDDTRALSRAPAPGGAKPPAHRRRLSARDARFVANVCGLADGARVLDPFAGRGTLAHALCARALDVTASDLVHAAVRECGAHARRARVLSADARALPFDDAIFDGVVTEPPYRVYERAAVLGSVRELARVVRAGGRIALLLADSMIDDVTAALTRHGCVAHERFTFKRHGLLCTLLVAKRPAR